MSETRGRPVPSILVAGSTAVVLVALAVVVFLNPIWVAFEQDRARADAWTGFPPSEVQRVTGEILVDLIVGPAAFDQVVAGRAVFEERERSHLRDVRAVFFGFGLLALLAVVAFAVAAWRWRGTAWFWRAIRRGTTALAAGVVVLGIVFGVAFDLAFEVFHRLFFAGGTYSFDPRTDRLVQLFPDQFWYETSIALGIVILVLALGLRLVAVRRAAGLELAAALPPARVQPGPVAAR